MTVEPLQTERGIEEAWDRLVVESNNGTIFHRLRFLRYHPPDRFQNHHLLFKKRHTLYAVMSGALYAHAGGTALVSHPGASYGGPVFGTRFRLDDASAMVYALIEYARREGFNRLDMTLPPISYMQSPHQTLEFALALAGFGYRKRELTHIVTLDTPPADLLQSLPGKTRSDVRQAMRLGLHVRWHDDPGDEELAVLCRMVNENRRQLGLDTPATHTLEELIRIRTLLPGMLTLGMTYTETTPIAGTLVFRCNPRALLTFYICHDRAYRDRHPVHLLLYDLLRRATCQGYRIVDFGISTVDMNPLHSLIRFKESFRAQGFFRETFEFFL